jgi:hypothetical protein
MPRPKLIRIIFVYFPILNFIKPLTMPDGIMI